MEYRLLPYIPEMKDEASSLLQHLSSSSRQDARTYFEWKYEENPFIRSPLVALVTYGSQVVGMRGLFGTAWTIRDEGRATVLPHADDLIVHPDHRNRGLFVLIDDYLVRLAREAGFSHILSLSGVPTTQQLAIATGWAEVGELRRMFRATASSRLSERSNLYRNSRRILVSMLRGKRRSDGGGSGDRARLPSDDDVESVVQSMRDRGSGKIRILRDPEPPTIERPRAGRANASLSPSRTAEYYRWRLANPNRKYRILVFEDPHPRGFAILSWSSPSARSLKIAEIVSSDPDVTRSLLEAVTAPKRAAIEMMESTQPDTTLETALSFGFRRNTELPEPLPPRRFLLRSTGIRETGQELPSMDDLSSWHVSLIDTMGA